MYRMLCFQLYPGVHVFARHPHSLHVVKKSRIFRRSAGVRCVLARPPESSSSGSSSNSDVGHPKQQQQDSLDVPRSNNSDELHPILAALNRATVSMAVSIVDKLYEGRDQYRRFYVLEVMARIPFFAYACMLHLSETLGVPSDEATRRLRDHFEQADNEAMHLAVMAEMGGGKHWLDKFLASHLSMLYFFISVVVFFISPALAYNFNELIELHAYDTYDKFIGLNEAALQTESAVPLLAHQYYTSAMGNPRRKIESMLDVLVAIRDDEREHSDALHRYTADAITGVFRPHGKRSR